MSETPETASPATTRDRSIEGRRAARLIKARREQRIVGLLNCGVSIPEIAAREGVTEKRMRAVVRDILARRMPELPAEFLALQVSRLNEALLVAYGAMAGGNLRAVDRVVRIVRELDRYHGFVAAEQRSSASQPRLEASAESPLALAAPPRACPEMAPQTAEMLQSAPGSGSAEDSPSQRDADPEPSEASPSRAPIDNEVTAEAPPTSPQMAPEALDILKIGARARRGPEGLGRRRRPGEPERSVRRNLARRRGPAVEPACGPGAPQLQRDHVRQWRRRESPDPAREGAGVGPVRATLHRSGWREALLLPRDAQRRHGVMSCVGYPPIPRPRPPLCARTGAGRGRPP